MVATAHKVEVKGVARPSRPRPGRDALVTLPQLYEQLQMVCKQILFFFILKNRKFVKPFFRLMKKIQKTTFPSFAITSSYKFLKYY